jgi:hypothetical protein
MDRTGTGIGKGYRWISEDVLFGLDIYPTGLCISLTRIRKSETGLVFRLHVQTSNSRIYHLTLLAAPHTTSTCHATTHVEIFYTWLSKIEHVRADKRYQQTSFSLQPLQARSSFQPILICPVYVSLYNNYTNTKKPYPTTNQHTNTPHRTNKNHMQANPTLKQHAPKSKSQPIKITFAANVCFFVSETHLSETKKLSLCADKQISEGKVGGPLMTRETKRPAPSSHPPKNAGTNANKRWRGKKKH